MFETVDANGCTLYNRKYWEDLTLLEKWDSCSSSRNTKLHVTIVTWFIDKSLKDNNVQVLTLALDYMNVPINLTLKERISYFQLLGDE